MRILYLVQALVVSFSLLVTPCHAKRAYVWTDEQGVTHISDQDPPKGVESTSFSTERDYPQERAGDAQALEQASVQSIESESRKRDQRGQASTSQTVDTRQDSQKAPIPKYRDEASLSRDEKIRLLLLDASKDHASKLYNTASSEDERRRWKAELDRIQKEEKQILEVGNK